MRLWKRLISILRANRSVGMIPLPALRRQLPQPYSWDQYPPMRLQRMAKKVDKSQRDRQYIEQLSKQLSALNRTLSQLEYGQPEFDQILADPELNLAEINTAKQVTQSYEC